jgi:C4-dicarboxylate transporter DctM subunit
MLLPVVTGLGMDPIHFGVIMMLNLAIGGTTPPLAVCLFTSTRIVGIRVEDCFPDILYVVGTMVFGLILVLLMPALTMWLPNTFM